MITRQEQYKPTPDWLELWEIIREFNATTKHASSEDAAECIAKLNKRFKLIRRGKGEDAIPTADIFRIIEEVTGYSHEQLRAKKTYGKIKETRQIAMRILREHGSLTLTAIGRVLDRDHTTVMSSLDRINNLAYCKDAEVTEVLGKLDVAIKEYLNAAQLAEIIAE